MLQGKGFFIWRIADCEKGDANAIANLANQAGMSHVLVKVADGTQSYNVDLRTKVDLAPAVVQALRARGISVLGWHYIYGYDPAGEANIAIHRVQQLKLDGYVIDAEREFKQPGKKEAARQFMGRLRAGLPNTPIALSSYRYPSFHPQIPWREFLERCDFNMPQVYWLQSHNPGDQLIRCVREFQSLVPFRPVIPTGAAFKEGNWSASAAETNDFLRTAQSLNLTAANFWEWSNCRRFIPAVWDSIQGYSWPATTTVVDISQQYIDALNTRDPGQVVGLYNTAAVHVTPARTLQGLVSIRTWYNALFGQILPQATFTLTGFSGGDSLRHLTWTAVSPRGSVHNGSDTFGLANGKISYHYSFFSVT